MMVLIDLMSQNLRPLFDRILGGLQFCNGFGFDRKLVANFATALF
ncbi:hypothetical protein HanPSC8_Chr10g0431451 [Helianthus annuus]|nr:hypothetical protein HanPSC8_Chr10g0431451 [Helianthus annuus]